MSLAVVGGIARYARSVYELVSNRRKFARTPFSGTILLTSGYAIETTRVCACVDMSPGGVGLESDEPLEVGAFVQVHSDEHGPRRVARVRYSVARGGVYRIGLQFVA